jgi:archaellum component FlaC
MTISPIQPMRGNYVTSGEFNEKFDEQKEYMDTGFNKLGEQIDHVEANLGKKIDDLKVEVHSTNVKVDSLTQTVNLIVETVTLLTKNTNKLIDKVDRIAIKVQA